MFPQAELENYKLQVELLQEKLRRSEDNRTQLEHKLDKVLQKRSDHEKTVRHKSRQAYHDFLEEQAQRNERNKKLVHMLERIDEQTAAMSQRSERLKMMKLQYQMYFAKLVQNQTLRCIQQQTANAGGATAAAATTMPTYPVLIQPQAASAAATATAQNPNQNQPLLYQMPAAAPQPQQWAFATPTPGGMLLSSQLAPQQVYMPYPDLYGAGQTHLTTSNLFDLRATLRALDNENADLPERMSRLPAGDTEKVIADRTMATPATAPSTPSNTSTMLATPCSTQDRSARQLSSAVSSASSSLLAFDKLPKTATLTELPTAAVADAVAGNDDVVVVGGGVGRPQELDGAWMPNSRVTKNEHEKSPSVASYNEPNRQQQQHQQQQQQQQHRPHNIDTYFGELKIDEPWQPRPTGQHFEDKMELNVRAGNNSMSNSNSISSSFSNLLVGDDLIDEIKASRAALQKAAAAVDEQLAKGNQLSPPTNSNSNGNSNNSSNGNELTPAKPKVSIENIENAIYGERLTATAPVLTTAAAAEATQGLFENVASNVLQPQLQQQQQQQHEVEQQQLLEQQQQHSTQELPQIDYGAYDGNSSYVDPNEPSYASIESSQQQLPQQQQANVAGEPLYSEIGNPTDDYQQYAADANAVAAAAAAAEVEADTDQQQQQQEYSNMDYSNYDASQYAAAGGYDPNAYPGYIYDETTGQYIADPNAAQYAPDGSYAGQEYDAGATNYDYYGEQQQQQQQQQHEEQEQQEQQEAAAYPISDTAATTAATELLLPQEVEQVPPPVGAVDAKTDGSHSTAKPAAVKPTSILASTDKQAAPNDAHQQQQQQQQQQQKKKKRVNFVDSSETDDSSSAKPAQELPPTATTTAIPTPTPTGAPAVAGSESDFDFSTGSEAKN